MDTPTGKIVLILGANSDVAKAAIKQYVETLFIFTLISPTHSENIAFHA